MRFFAQTDDTNLEAMIDNEIDNAYGNEGYNQY